MGHPDPEIREDKERPGPFGPVWPKNKGGAGPPGPSPESGTLTRTVLWFSGFLC